MKNYSLFFMKCLFVHVWMNLTVFSVPVFGQETDSLSVPVTTGIGDSVSYGLPGDSLQTVPDSIQPSGHQDVPVAQQPAVGDSVPSLPADSASIAASGDSLSRRVVVGLADPLDTLSNRLFAYQVLSKNSYARLQVPIDTTLDRFHINHPVMRNYYAGAHLGNTGLSYYPIGFEARKRPSDFLFLDHVSDYLHDPEAAIYYQTQKPYTLIDYSSAGPKAQNESILKVVHSQNVNKNWNVGLYYDIFASSGQFANQNASDNGFSLFSAYRGSQYSMYTSFNWNNTRMRENGGLSDMEFFAEDTHKAPDQSVRSQSGRTVLINRSLYLMQSYSPRKLIMGKKRKTSDSIDVSRFTILQTFKYEWNKRDFSDTATYAYRGKHAPYFGTPDTHDSLYFRRLSNHFELMFKEQTRNRFTAGFSAGILTELDRYNNNIVPDTIKIGIQPHVPENTGWGGELPALSGEEQIIRHRVSRRYTNTALTGRFFNHTGRYLNWDFNGQFFFTGYKLGNLNINGTVQLHYDTPKGRNTLLLGGSIDNAKPGYFLNDYASNWLRWNNNFNASQEIRLRGEFISPHRSFKAGVYVSQLNNYVYINREALPEQTAEALVTGTALIEKNIRWWKFGFMFRLYAQYSSHEKIIPLPAVAGYQSTYFESWLVPDVLTMRLGWDIHYHTKYYAYAYMPSSGMFYLQEEQQIGNYPFFDVFLSLQIKRARIFVKTDGLNTMLNQQLGKDYYMVYRYPLNEFRMKFGISWAFYD